MAGTQHKIKSETEIIEIAHKLRSESKNLVTSNGSFDIFHAGHVEFLEEAKAQGDILIVGVNSDQSVKAYKSADRPIISQDGRMRVIASLACVDFVFCFDDLIPNRWLELIRPQVHVNGAEYGENCVEKPVLDQIGARLYLVSRDESVGSATTKIIERIRKLK